MKPDFTPNCFSKYKIIRVLDHDLSVCITQDDKIKLLRVEVPLDLQLETRIAALTYLKRQAGTGGSIGVCPLQCLWDKVKETKNI